MTGKEESGGPGSERPSLPARGRRVSRCVRGRVPAPSSPLPAVPASPTPSPAPTSPGSPSYLPARGLRQPSVAHCRPNWHWSTPFSAVPSLSPPAGSRRHVIPPPSRPAPPPQPSSRSACLRRAPPTRASPTDDVAGAGTLGKAQGLVVPRFEVRGVGSASERGKWGTWKTEGSRGKERGEEKT